MGLTSELLVRLTADGKGVKPGLDDAAKYFKKFNDDTLSKTSKTLSLLAPRLGSAFESASSMLGKFTGALSSSAGRWMLMAAPLLAIPAAFGLALNHAKAISALAKEAGVSTPEAQRLLYGSDMSGVDVGPLLGKLREARSKALLGGQEEITSFARLKITLQDIERLNSAELLDKIAAAAANGTLNSTNFAAAVKLLGEQSRDAIPSLGRLHDEMGKFDANGGASSSTNSALMGAERAKGRVGKQVEWTSKGWAALFSEFVMNSLAWAGGGAAYSVGAIGKLAHRGNKRQEDYFSSIQDYGIELRGGALSEYYKRSNLEQLAILEARLRDRQAVKALRAEQRRAANNAYIDDLYARMYESGAPAGAAAGGGSGSPAKAGGASGAFSFATLTQSDQLARVGLYSATGSALNQQLQTERDTLSELRQIKGKLVSLGIEFNKD